MRLSKSNNRLFVEQSENGTVFFNDNFEEMQILFADSKKRKCENPAKMSYNQRAVILALENLRWRIQKGWLSAEYGAITINMIREYLPLFSVAKIKQVIRSLNRIDVVISMKHPRTKRRMIHFAAKRERGWKCLTDTDAQLIYGAVERKMLI